MRAFTVVVGVFTVVVAGIRAAEPRVLLDPRPGMSLDGIEAKESRLSVTAEGWLRVDIGAARLWPGVTVPGPAGGWDLSGKGRLEMVVRNPGAAMIAVSLRVDTFTDGGEVTWQTRSLRVGAGETGTLRMDLSRRGQSDLGGRLFGMRGYPSVAQGDRKADPRRVSRLLVFLPKGTGGKSFEIGRMTASGPVVSPTASVDDADPFFPFVDPLGQYRHRDWPGKTQSVAEMKARGRAEAAALEADAGPLEWSRYGGWTAGPRMEATGAFRPVMHAGK